MQLENQKEIDFIMISYNKFGKQYIARNYAYILQQALDSFVSQLRAFIISFLPWGVIIAADVHVR